LVVALTNSSTEVSLPPLIFRSAFFSRSVPFIFRYGVNHCFSKKAFFTLLSRRFANIHATIILFLLSLLLLLLPPPPTEGTVWIASMPFLPYQTTSHHANCYRYPYYQYSRRSRIPRCPHSRLAFTSQHCYRVAIAIHYPTFLHHSFPVPVLTAR